MKIIILGVKIDDIGKNEAKNFIEERISTQKKTLVMTPNPELIVRAQKDNDFLTVLNSADLSLADGYGLLLASKILRTDPLLSEKIPGTDIAEELLSVGQSENWKIGVVGARRGEKKEIDMVIGELVKKYPELRIKAMETSENWDKERLDLVFCCQVNGIREQWMVENYKIVNGTVFLGIGAALDFISGMTRRAPVWMQKTGFEWLWRLITKPKTHLKRVWNAVFVFLWLVVKERLLRSQR